MQFVDRKLRYPTVHGTWKYVMPMSLLAAHKFSSTYTELMEYESPMFDGETQVLISDLYVADSMFNSLCNECLELAGIEPADISIDVLISLLFPHKSEQDEQIQNVGELVKFNFPDKDTHQDYKKQKAQLDELLASIWLITEDLQKALNSLDLLCAEDLASVMKARANIMKDPVQREKEDSFQSALDIAKQRGLLQ